MYQDTITLFNRKKKSDNDVWYPTIIRNVNLNIDKAAILAKYGAESQDKAMLSIRYKNNEQDVLIAGKPWKPPIEWEEQVNELLPETMTFQSGDIFMQGEWLGSNPIEDAEYEEGFYDYLSKKLDYVFLITEVSGPYVLIPHFEIMGR